MKRRFFAVITLVALVAALLAAAPARAASDRWTTHGPEGAWVSELVIDPQHPATVYAGTQSGIFKTTDGGGRWRRLSGFPAADAQALAIAPSDPDVLYAAVHEAFGPNNFPVYRSLDAGMTWKRVIANADLDTGVTYPQPRQRIVIDPSEADIVYVATFDGGVLKSSDGGRHWQRAVSGFDASEFDTRVFNIAIGPLRPRTLLAAATTGLWRSRDGAATWLPVAKLPKFRDIRAIAFDPSDQRVAYAGGDKGLFRSTDTGNTWSRVGDLPVGPDFQVVEVSIAPSDPDVIYVGDWNGHVYRSRDGAESWKLTDHDFGPTLTLPIAVHPSDPSTLYAGTERRRRRVEEPRRGSDMANGERRAHGPADDLGRFRPVAAERGLRGNPGRRRDPSHPEERGRWEHLVGSRPVGHGIRHRSVEPGCALRGQPGEDLPERRRRTPLVVPPHPPDRESEPPDPLADREHEGSGHDLRRRLRDGLFRSTDGGLHWTPGRSVSATSSSSRWR